jgi:hypothetical protein
MQQPAGAPAGNRNAAKTTFDNIQVCSESAEKAPTGTSAQAGIRRLRKEVEAGNDKAKHLLAEFEAGEVSVNGALVELGLRKKTVTLHDSPERIASALILRVGVEGAHKLIGADRTGAGRAHRRMGADRRGEAEGGGGGFGSS